MSEFENKNVEFNSAFDIAKKFLMSKKVVILFLMYIYTLDIFMADKGMGLYVLKDNIPSFISDYYDYIYHVTIFTILFVFSCLFVKVVIFNLTHKIVFKDIDEYLINNLSKEKRKYRKEWIYTFSRVEDVLVLSIFYLTVIHLLLNYVIVDNIETKIFHLVFILLYSFFEYISLRNLLYVKGFLVGSTVWQMCKRILVFVAFTLMSLAIVRLVFLNNIPL